MSEAFGNTSSLERTPPQNVEAEEFVLGSMMLSKDAIADVVEILRETDFYRPEHAAVYRVIIDLFGKGEPADAVTVAAELKRRGELERVGSDSKLHTFVSMVSTYANAAYYAKIVREQAQLRDLVNVGTRIVQLGYAADGSDVDSLLNMAQSEVYNMTESRSQGEYAVLETILPGVIEEIEMNAGRDGKLAGVPTGFPDLDGVMNGLRPGQMIIVAARPGLGKSTFSLDICRAAAIHNKLPVVYFSLEMNRNELVMKVLSAESGIYLNKMIKGNLSQDEWGKVAEVAERISESPLIVDDSPNLTLSEIRAKSRRLRQQNNIQLIVIDYLQLLSSGGRAPESRQQEVSEFSRSIKLLAKELEVPIIAVAQLNRESVKRENKRPQVSDLRESGSLEQDADAVILIHRDNENQDLSMRDATEIIIGKHRAGPTGVVNLTFQGSLSRFVSQANVPEEDF